MTVSAYLQELINQKKALANNLVEKGVQASEDEKFNTLVPKVLDVIGGSNLDTSDATATSDDILKGKTAYVNEEKVIGTIEIFDGEIENGVEIPNTVDGYEGDYSIIPSTENQILDTQNKLLKQNIEIKAIPYTETENSAGGITVTIG